MCVCVVRDAKKMVRSTVKHVGGGVLHVAASNRFQRVHCCGLGRRFFIFNLSGKGAELLTQVEWFEPHNRVIKSFLSDA